MVCFEKHLHVYTVSGQGRFSLNPILPRRYFFYNFDTNKIQSIFSIIFKKRRNYSYYVNDFS